MRELTQFEQLIMKYRTAKRKYRRLLADDDREKQADTGIAKMELAMVQKNLADMTEVLYLEGGLKEVEPSEENEIADVDNE